ncbi:MAG TPA: LacI family transcriptional regulator, partial [Mycobacterium tuberculosis]|nr:LacI family transcriptional regulator [Mycobacterium tuberculosis]
PLRGPHRCRPSLMGRFLSGPLRGPHRCRPW